MLAYKQKVKVKGLDRKYSVRKYLDGWVKRSNYFDQVSLILTLHANNPNPGDS